MPSIAEAAALDVLAADGLVAFPTETVWGLAARAKSHIAIERLRAFKGREADKALSILLDSPERATDVSAEWGQLRAHKAKAAPRTEHRTPIWLYLGRIR